jgi:REP element-mobilizing transposase RayT
LPPLRNERKRYGGRRAAAPKTMPLGYLNPYHEVTIKLNRLTHWEQRDATYFVTFRLGDSIPKDVLDQWVGERDEWLKRHPPPRTDAMEKEFYTRFPSKIEQWLDAAYGTCILKSAVVRVHVEETLRCFDGLQYFLYSWVVMPNHAHILFGLSPENSLGKVVGAWKGVSARRINALSNTTGALWQKDYFDRMIRDEAHFWRCAHYMRNNPSKVAVPSSEYTLFESELVKKMLG